jgi:hypothetical protein
LCLCKADATAQSINYPDSLLYNRAVTNVKALYHAGVGQSSGLYNGSQFTGYRSVFENDKHPFFSSSKPQTGSVFYDHLLYPDVPLLFDEVKQVLVFQSSTTAIQLVNEKIQHFSIGSHHFIHLGNPDTEKGFYEVLHDGNSQILKKESKSIMEDISSVADGIKYFIKTKTSYYIGIDGKITEISREKSLFPFLQPNKQKWQQLVKKDGLNFRKKPEGYLVAAGKFIDNLKLLP